MIGFAFVDLIFVLYIYVIISEIKLDFSSFFLGLLFFSWIKTKQIRKENKVTNSEIQKKKAKI